MFKSILFPIDLNDEKSWNSALPKAIALASQSNALLHFVAVVPEMESSLVRPFLPDNYIDKLIKKTQAALAAFIEQNVTKDIQGESRVAKGSVAKQISKIAIELECDLIVMAPFGRSLGKFFLGTNSEFVLGHTPISILVVRDGA